MWGAGDISPGTALAAAWGLVLSHKGPLFSLVAGRMGGVGECSVLKQKLVPKQRSSCLGKSYFQRVGFNGPPSPPDF